MYTTARSLVFPDSPTYFRLMGVGRIMHRSLKGILEGGRKRSERNGRKQRATEVEAEGGRYLRKCPWRIFR